MSNRVSGFISIRAALYQEGHSPLRVSKDSPTLARFFAPRGRTDNPIAIALGGEYAPEPKEEAHSRSMAGTVQRRRFRRRVWRKSRFFTTVIGVLWTQTDTPGAKAFSRVRRGSILDALTFAVPFSVQLVASGPPRIPFSDSLFLGSTPVPATHCLFLRGLLLLRHLFSWRH